MDKNTIIGFALIAAVLFGFTWFNQPTAEDVEAQRISDSLAVINQQKKEQAEIAEIQRQAAAAKAMAEDSTALFFNNMKGVEGRVTLENEKIALTFNTKGAVVEKAVIKNFEDLNGAKDLTLFDKTTQSLNFIFTTKEQNISTKDLYFDVKKSADGKQLIFVAGDNLPLVYTFNILAKMAYAPAVPLLWTMLADVADYGEWKFNRRTTGLCFSASVLAQKLGWAIGAAAAGWVLSATHFVANADLQSDSALMGIRLLVSIIPGVLYASCALVMIFYNLDNATMVQMKNDLDARRINNSDTI